MGFFSLFKKRDKKIADNLKYGWFVNETQAIRLSDVSSIWVGRDIQRDENGNKLEVTKILDRTTNTAIYTLEPGEDTKKALIKVIQFIEQETKYGL